MRKILPVLLCGGRGMRLWPLTQEMPKPFLPLLNGQSPLQHLLMLLDENIFAPPLLVTHSHYYALAKEQVEPIHPHASFLLEPCPRDSGPAVASAVIFMGREDPKAIMAVFATDQWIEPHERFLPLCQEAGRIAAKGYITALGMIPQDADPGYGYIQKGPALPYSPHAFRIQKYIEKPDALRAKDYITQGYVWNSGNFFFRADVMAQEFQRHAPEIYTPLHQAVGKDPHLEPSFFAQAPALSLDHAIMEKTDKAAVIQAQIKWRDIGTWERLFTLQQPDLDGNIVQGRGILHECTNTYIHAEDVVTTVVGVQDLRIISTRDAILIAHHTQSHRLKSLLPQLHNMPGFSQKCRKPWGYYQSIDHGKRYQVKRLVVNPGHSLSLQKHLHRAEHWIVVQGTALVQVQEFQRILHENESIFIPEGSLHQLSNPGKIDLELIEVQTGSYLGEDDIIRLEELSKRG